MGLLLVVLVLVLLFIWLKIDFTLGLRKQKQSAQKHDQLVRHSELKLLATGDDFFSQLIQDMQNASQHIHLLFYIFRDDHIGKKIICLLEEKARQGVAVRLLVDQFGSSLSRKHRKKLRQAGVVFAYAHPPQFPFLFFTFNRRNHRKLSIIDGQIGYIGGYNVGDEYLGRNPKFGTWRDFHIRMIGDGVQDLQEQFIQDWQTAKQDDIPSNGLFPALRKGEHPIRILPTDGAYLEESFIALVKQAKSAIILGTPYYIPGKRLQSELIKAARRGVDVRLIVPRISDHPLVREAAFPYFNGLLEEGIEIYQYYRGFFHAKAIVIDEQMCDIGTANFDQRSFHINHEISCLIYDKAFVRTVRCELESDMRRSEKLTMKAYESRSWTQRSKEKVATLLSGLL